MNDKQAEAAYTLTPADIVIMEKMGRLEKENANLKKELRWIMQCIDYGALLCAEDVDRIRALVGCETVTEPIAFDEKEEGK